MGYSTQKIDRLVIPLFLSLLYLCKNMLNQKTHFDHPGPTELTTYNVGPPSYKLVYKPQ